MRSMQKSMISAGMALIMTCTAVPLAVFAEGAQVIDCISLCNVSTSLTIGVIPEYTAFLTDGTEYDVSILNEGWALSTDTSVHASRSEMGAVPTAGEYIYLAALTCGKDSYFSDHIELYYDGWQIEPDNYIARVTDEGQFLILYLTFLSPVYALSPDDSAISAVYIGNAQLEYAAGAVPAFSALSAEPSRYDVEYERWSDDLHPGRFVTSDPNLNEFLGMTDETEIQSFEAGGQYHYDISIAASAGCAFSDDVTVFINGMPYTPLGFSPDCIPLNDVTVLTIPDNPPEETTVTTDNTEPVTTDETEPVTTDESEFITQTTASATETVNTETEATTAEYDPSVLYGDVNQNGSVSLADYVLLLHVLCEDDSFSLTGSAWNAADMNRDGMLTLADARLITAYLRDHPAQPTVFIPAHPEDETEELPDLPDTPWILLPEGHSAAFTETPIPGLTVSAEENALSYDGQLQIREITDEECAMLNEKAAEENAIWLDAFHLDAGLSPEETLPGTYHSAYDLSTLEIPEEMYDQIAVERIDGNGDVWRIPAERNGNLLEWDADQNSWFWFVFIPIAGYAAYKIYQKKYDERFQYGEGKSVWSDESKSCVTCKEFTSCFVYYEDHESADVKKARQERMQAAEAAADKQAKQQAREEVMDDTGAFFVFWVMERKINRRAAVLKNQLLQNNAEYQKDLAESTGVAPDAKLIADTFAKAEWYLHYYEGTPYLGYKPDIILSSNVPGDGSAGTPWSHKHYMQIHRKDDSISELVAEDTSYDDIRGNQVSVGDADKYLITITHETYHLMQEKKYFTDYNQKFNEMSAIYVEHRCGAHYLDYYMIDSYACDIDDFYETYAVPINCHKGDEDLIIGNGYALAGFIEFIQQKKGITPIKGWDLILLYLQSGKDVLKTIENIFGFAQMVTPEDNPRRVTDIYWRAYQRYLNETSKLNGRFRTVYADAADSSNSFPSQMRKNAFTENQTAKHFSMQAADFTCKMVGMEGYTNDPWSVILERDEGYAEMLPHSDFMRLDTSGGESAHGYVVNTREKILFYRERQDLGNLGNSGYTAHYIPAPQTPKVDIDEDAQEFTVHLQSAQSKEGATGLTDCFLLSIRVDGNETYTQIVEFDKYQEDIVIPFLKAGLVVRQANNVRIMVCEYIREAGEFKAVRTADSKPFEWKIDNVRFPVIDTKFSSLTGQYGNATFSSIQLLDTFTLDKDGNFQITVHGDSFAQPKITEPSYNPFVEDCSIQYSYTGFTVTGKVEKADVPTEWTAKITSCSPNTFHAETHTQEFLYNDFETVNPGVLSFRISDDKGPEYVETDEVWSGSFSGEVSGTLKFYYNPETGAGSVNVLMDVPMVSAKREEKTTGSIRVTGLFTAAAS